MRRIDTFPQADALALRGLLFDLDDTFLDRGRLTLEAYTALFTLKDAGLRLFVVTGRPARWGRFTVAQWPIDGAVTENGGMSCVRDGERLVERASPGIDLESIDRRLRQVGDAIRGRFPELELTDDVGGRRTDITFDIGEARRAPSELIAAVTRFARAQGATTQCSSIHLHVSFHGYDKASGALSVLHSVYGEDPTQARFRYAYIGDSENDAPCFAAFRASIGVANLSGRPTLTPRYGTLAPRAGGFAEAARVLVGLRTAGRA